jgi:hypothetical protein
MQEAYAQAPGGQRLVQYFDKSRMEINNPAANAVTNGLLSKELITGEMQMGDATFETRAAAWIPVAGDPDDTDGPLYATFREFLSAPPASIGATITDTINRAGTRGTDAGLARYGVTIAYLVPETKHTIATPFWDFLQMSGLVQTATGLETEKLFEPTFFATGLPITEAYWAKVKVGGQTKDVLVQAFERRVLTYTPANPAGYLVEMGNVGRHYYGWRYEGLGKAPGPPPVKSAKEIVLDVTDLPAGYQVTADEPLNDGRGHYRVLVNSNMVNSGFVVLHTRAFTTPSPAVAAGVYEAWLNDMSKRKGSSTEAIAGVGEQAFLNAYEEKVENAKVRTTTIVFRRGPVVALLQGAALPQLSDPGPLIEWTKIMDGRAARYTP